MQRYDNAFDPHYRQHAKQDARAKAAGDTEYEAIQGRAMAYVPGYGNPAPQNTRPPTMLGGGRTETGAWDEMFKRKDPFEGPVGAPPAKMPIYNELPAINPRATATPTTSAPQTSSSGVTSPAEMARIRAQYGTPQANTPPTSIVPQGNPNALKPGQGWQSSQYDPRGTTLLRAPDGIQERVGYGGHIASMYRPPAYNGPGESPTGIVHNTPTPFHKDNTAQQAMIKQLPQLAEAGSPANSAFVQTYHQTRDPQKALAAAMEAHKSAANVNAYLNATPPPPIQQI